MDDNFIYERLKALSGGIDREQYRDISKAFAEVVKYNRQALEALQQQISQELRDVSERFYLYGAVTKISDAPIVNDFLFPMSQEEVQESISTVFCECSLLDMEEIFSSDQVMLIETAEETLELSVKICPCQRYLDKIDHLQKIFFDNGIYWRTPYLPYVSKFGDIYCTNFDKEKKIRSIRFKDKNIPVRHDLIPLWNVEPIHLKCTVFPIPAVDEQNYKHILRLPFAQDGYTVVLEHCIKNMYFNHEELVLITDEKVQRDFEVYRIAVRRDIPVPHYVLTTNYRPMRHIDRQADHSMTACKSRADIGRIISSYIAADKIQLDRIEVGKIGEIMGAADPYAYVTKGREKLMLMFWANHQTFLTLDLISFLVSEVQSYFPQFLVSGSLDP